LSYLKSKVERIGVPKLTLFVLECSKAIVFLHGKNIVHGNIAARNFFIVDTNIPTIKLSDFGPLNPNNLEYVVAKLPTDWYAPEVFINKIDFTVESDVWSFGITCSEILSQGQRMYKSEKCDWKNLDLNELWRIIEVCLEPNPAKRSPISVISKAIEEFQKRIESPDSFFNEFTRQ